MARDFYRALRDAPQAVYFELTDWQYAKIATTFLSAALTCPGSATPPPPRVRTRDVWACGRCSRLVKITGAGLQRVYVRHRRANLVAEAMNTFDAMSKRLLVTEPDRRRNRIEIVRSLEGDTPNAPIPISGFRAQLAGERIVDPEDEDEAGGEDEDE